jgi:hypothetical protein
VSALQTPEAYSGPFAAAGLTSPPGCIGATIITRSGTYFDFLNPESTPLTIEDIAAGLSRCCRYSGQLPDHIDHYSVAQHSVHVSEILPPELALQGLLHDAFESVGGDMVSPLKQLCPDYKAVEKRGERAIFKQFGLPETLDPLVKRADYILLNTEKRDITTARNHAWPGMEAYPPLEKRIWAWGARYARRQFLDRYFELLMAARHG